MTPSVVALLDALDARVRGGARAKLNLRAPAPEKLTALKAEIGDLAKAGWGAHDGQDRPVKKHPTIQGAPAKPAMHWLPGDFRWVGIDEALDLATSRFQRFADSRDRSGRLVFRDREDYGPGRTVASSLEHFFDQYLRSLEKDRLRWDAKSKRVTFGRKALLFAFSAD